jgi:inhibitor of KinA sporulation pathway (predicted exonuclease)
MTYVAPNPINFLSLDLELNQPSNLIIQIGAVAGNLKTGEVVGRLSVFVRIPEPLNPYIVTLTGITEEMLEKEGVDLLDAYQQLKRFHEAHLCHTNPITWGGGDSREVQEQLLTLYPNVFDKERYLFGRRWFDVKTTFQDWCFSQDIKMQGGLAKSMTKLGLAFRGRKHRADDDAYNTFVLKHELLKKFRR